MYDNQSSPGTCWITELLIFKYSKQRLIFYLQFQIKFNLLLSLNLTTYIYLGKLRKALIRKSTISLMLCGNA